MTDRCRGHELFGAWGILPDTLAGMVDAIKGTDLAAVQAATAAMPQAPAYTVADGVATISLDGPLTKHDSSLASIIGGTSTIGMRRALRAALRDETVKAILLAVDSPGGTVAGTGDAADAVREAAKIKPVIAVCSDACASAAYWIASAATSMYVNESGLVGSLGVFSVLEDSSGKYEREGIKVHVVRSGQHKGSGTPGSVITDAQLAEAQARVDALNGVFLSAVARNRGMSEKAVRALADGRLFVGKQAIDAGLVDGIATIEGARAIAAKATVQTAPRAIAPTPAPIRKENVLPMTYRPTPSPTPAPLAEVAAYNAAVNAAVSRGMSLGYARAYVNREQPQLRAALVHRLRQEIAGPRAAELAEALRPDPEAA